MRLFLVLGLVCALVQPASAQFKGGTLKELDQAGMQAVRPKVKSIRAEPSTITIKVGQVISLDAITVVVVDSAGKDLGRIRGFDFGIPPLSAAEAVPRKVTGKKV